MTCPMPMPRIPSIATDGNARHGSRCRPTMNRNSNGTATAKRNAVNVRGGMVSRPSFVTGIESPNMTASNSIAPIPRAVRRAAWGARAGGVEPGTVVLSLDIETGRRQ